MGTDSISFQSLKPPKPQEHGAWGMLYIPFAIGIGVAGVINTALAVALAGVTLAFLAQRPLRELILNQAAVVRRRNTVWLVILAGSSAVCFGLLYWTWQLQELHWLGVAAAPLILVMLYLVRVRAVHSIPAELIGILLLTMSAPLAHYLGSGSLQATAFLLWGLSALYFGSSVFYVKTRVQQFVNAKGKARLQVSMARRCVAYHLGLAALVVILAVTSKLHWVAGLAFSPILVRGLWLNTGNPTKLNLRAIGYREVAYSILFSVLLILSFRT
ncbi:MAG: YwiC-like family protein [Acidobacteriota bacterium]